MRGSKHARARITRLDVSAVAAMTGVAAVMTAADIPYVNDVGPAYPGEPTFAAVPTGSWLAESGGWRTAKFPAWICRT